MNKMSVLIERYVCRKNIPSFPRLRHPRTLQILEGTAWARVEKHVTNEAILKR